jgi:hypothetical protein
MAKWPIHGLHALQAKAGFAVLGLNRQEQLPAKSGARPGNESAVFNPGIKLIRVSNQLVDDLTVRHTIGLSVWERQSPDNRKHM